MILKTLVQLSVLYFGHDILMTIDLFIVVYGNNIVKECNLICARMRPHMQSVGYPMPQSLDTDESPSNSSVREVIFCLLIYLLQSLLCTRRIYFLFFLVGTRLPHVDAILVCIHAYSFQQFACKTLGSTELQDSWTGLGYFCHLSQKK